MRVKGVRDILPAEARLWQQVEETVRKAMAVYGYQEIRTPAFEPTELFVRGVGSETDIVGKEMYTFTDQGGKSLTLKPELTAPVIRAYIQNSLHKDAPLTRLYYVDALYRQERPQKGRLRQFHQFGVEAIGSPHPEQDVEVMALAYELCQAFVPAGLSVRLNTIGSPETRRDYLTRLREALQPHLERLSELDRHRLDTNPLRLFDSKREETQAVLDKHAPLISDHISEDDQAHFDRVKAGLEALGIPYNHDPKLVRGLDYYTRTTFEITAQGLGAQDALCGGGRYDGLVAELGGQDTPAVGFATGVERLLMAAEDYLKDQHNQPQADVYFVVMGMAAMIQALALAKTLRDAGIRVVMETLRRSPKAQFREANRSGAQVALILGDAEIEKQTYTVKRMDTGEQVEVGMEKLCQHVEKILSDRP